MQVGIISPAIHRQTVLTDDRSSAGTRSAQSRDLRLRDLRHTVARHGAMSAEYLPLISELLVQQRDQGHAAKASSTSSTSGGRSLIDAYFHQIEK